MVWQYLLLMCVLLLRTVRCRPVPDPRLQMEGIDPVNNEHECGYPTNPEALRPWEINQGLCPPAIADLCRAEVPDSDTGRGPLYEYRTPFFEGDIILDWDDRTAMQEREQQNANENKEKEQSKTATKSRTARAIHKAKDFWWPGGKIPYIIDERFAEEMEKMIKKALRHWEKMTCVDFKTKKEKDEDYIRFVYQPGCWSYVGRQGGEQLISMGPGCNVFATIVHEVGHAIGLWHEQSRRDRDTYVKILLENVASGTEDNFGKFPKENVTSLGYAYDYESIMHYAPNAFSVTGRPTIKIKKIGKPYGFQMGQQTGLSALDVAQVKGMYKCNKKDAAQRQEMCVESKLGDGREYRGELDYTVDNVTCQYWTSQWPHKHKIYDSENEAINKKKGIGNHNYCRNPSGHRDQPWCFTTLKKERWQYCNVKICNNSETKESMPKSKSR